MVRDAQPKRAHVTYHERAADAGPERLKQVLGIIALKASRPSGRFLTEIEEDGADREDERARD